ncbi:hypothetical protein LEP1GSC161_1191 [Leptospira santarosai str. CBC1416]|uniref:Uncharacterized protein n=1 Tax=Leptospira santarosai str. CBC1416 TaxID=1193059 RepID=M6W7E7_9LEPT|nr:hypothetical protein LEP1GSC168_1841 [Leptospira santarosai str. HAI134]EMO57683.1 hypothetical protein LEP1GSC161_1191 [Leptospira santarosai str. CBC1416]
MNEGSVEFEIQNDFCFLIIGEIIPKNLLNPLELLFLS